MISPLGVIMRSRSAGSSPGTSTVTTSSSSVSWTSAEGVQPASPSGSPRASSSRRPSQWSRSSRSDNTPPRGGGGGGSRRSLRHGSSSVTLSMKPMTRLLLRPHGDLLGLHLGRLGDLDPQHAIPQRGGGGAGVQVFGQREGALV